jgi:hypothetical protein
VKPDADGGQGESCHTGHLLSGDFDPIRPKQAMICPDCAIHPRPPGATLLAFDVPSPHDCDLQSNSVRNMGGSMTRMCVIGEADPFVARLLKRFAAESGLQTVVHGCEGLRSVCGSQRCSMGT